MHACFLSIRGAADFISIEVQAWFPPIQVGACFACFLRLHLISAAHLLHKWLKINQLFDSGMTPCAQIYISGDHFSTLAFIIYQHKHHSKLSHFWQSNPRLPSFQCRPLQQHRSIQSWILSTLTSCQTTPKVAIVLLNIKNVTLCWAVRKTDKVFWSSKEDLPKSYPRSRNSELSDKWHRPPYLSCLPQCNAAVHSNQIGVGHRKSHIDSIGMTLMGRISARNVKTAQILSWCSCTAFQ